MNYISFKNFHFWRHIKQYPPNLGMFQRKKQGNIILNKRKPFERFLVDKTEFIKF